MKDSVVLALCPRCHVAVQHRRLWGSGLGDGLVLRSSHSLQIMMNLSLFVGWRDMTRLNCLCRLLLIRRRNWVHCTVFQMAYYAHHPRSLCLSCNLKRQFFLLSWTFRPGWRSRSFAAQQWKRRSGVRCQHWWAAPAAGLSLQTPTTALPTAAEVVWWVWGQPGNTKGTAGALQKHSLLPFFFPSTWFVCVWRDWAGGR